MSYANQEDWVHVDDYHSEFQLMEDQIVDLEQQVKELSDDEVYILSEIMYLKDYCSDYKEIQQGLASLINLHSQSVKNKAVEMLLKKRNNFKI